MGRGRAPCCDKNKVKKGPWSPAEDLKLISFIHQHGHTNWRSLPNQAGLLRCGKSCRLRWINYLRPDLKRGNFTPEEEQIIINLHNSIGNKWSKIASHLPGRTDNEIKNVWNTHLKKRVLLKKDDGSHESEAKSSTISYAAISSSSSKSITSCGERNMEQGHGDQDDQQSMAKNPNKKQHYLTVSPRKCNLIDETKQHSGSNTPSSSYASNFSRPNEETSSMVDITGSCDQVPNVMSEVTNQMPPSQAFEIPLESDIDIWNILNTLDPSKSSESQPHEYNEVCHHSSNSGEDFDPQVQCKKWLKNLEYELGLLGESNDDNQEMDAGSQVNTGSAHSDMILQPEIDIDTDYFPIWPSSPQNFGI